MRKALVTGLLLAAALPAVAVAKAPARAALTGKISALTARSVTIRDGRALTCTVAKVSPLSLGYVVGSGARVTCVGGVLSKIVGTDHPLPLIHVNASAPSTSAPHTTIPVTSSTSAKGPIIALTPSSITVGDTTCSLGQDGYQTLTAEGVKVGVVATVSCSTLQNGSMTGQVTIP